MQEEKYAGLDGNTLGKILKGIKAKVTSAKGITETLRTSKQFHQNSDFGMKAVNKVEEEAAKASKAAASGKPIQPKADDFLEHLPKDEHIVSTRPLTDEEKTKWLRNRIGEYGTNSMLDPFVHMAKGIGGKIAPNKINDKTFVDALVKYQKPLLDADRRWGEKASKTPLIGKMFKTLDPEPAIMHTTNTGKQIVDTVPKEGYRLTAPIDKTKKFAMPVLGVLGIQQVSEMVTGKGPNQAAAQQVAPEDYNANNVPKKASEEGDGLVTKISSDFNKEVIEKISNMLDTSIAEKNSALEKASGMLKRAAVELKRLNEEIYKLSDDNKKLTLSVIAKERSQRAVKLANEMSNKGLIKKAELTDEIDRIMDMDDNAFNILNDTVSKVAREKPVVKTDRLDKISGLYEYNFNEPQLSSLADEIRRG